MLKEPAEPGRREGATESQRDGGGARAAPPPQPAPAAPTPGSWSEGSTQGWRSHHAEVRLAG